MKLTKNLAVDIPAGTRFLVQVSDGDKPLEMAEVELQESAVVFLADDIEVKEIYARKNKIEGANKWD